MGKAFVRVESESYALLDKETGEVSELQESFVVDEDRWIQLYSSLFFDASGKVAGQSLKVFCACLKYAQLDYGDGNYVCTNSPNFLRDINRFGCVNISRCLADLCEAGMLERIKRGLYRINPKMAYLGNRSDRAKLVLKITGVRKEL